MLERVAVVSLGVLGYRYQILKPQRIQAATEVRLYFGNSPLCEKQVMVLCTTQKTVQLTPVLTFFDFLDIVAVSDLWRARWLCCQKMDEQNGCHKVLAF